MLSLNLRAALSSNLQAGPLLAQGCAVAPAGFTGGDRVHTYLADAKGAMVTSHIVEGRAASPSLTGRSSHMPRSSCKPASTARTSPCGG